MFFCSRFCCFYWSIDGFHWFFLLIVCETSEDNSLGSTKSRSTRFWPRPIHYILIVLPVERYFSSNQLRSLGRLCPTRASSVRSQPQDAPGRPEELGEQDRRQCFSQTCFAHSRSVSWGRLGASAQNVLSYELHGMWDRQSGASKTGWFRSSISLISAAISNPNRWLRRDAFKTRAVWTPQDAPKNSADRMIGKFCFGHSRPVSWWRLGASAQNVLSYESHGMLDR